MKAENSKAVKSENKWSSVPADFWFLIHSPREFSRACLECATQKTEDLIDLLFSITSCFCRN